MNKLILILVLPFLVFGSKYGKVKIWDGDTVVGVTGDSALYVAIKEPLETNGAIPVNIQDQTTQLLDLYFTQAKGAPTSLVEATIFDSSWIRVASVVGVSAGDYIGVFGGDTASPQFYFGEAISISSDTIFLDTPLDFVFDSADNVVCTSREMNVDGSTTRQIFTIQAGGVTSPIEVDLTRLIFTMTSTTSMDDARFGGISALTYGIVLRQVDGVVRNFWNIKSNSDFIQLSYDVTYSDKAPAGFYGFRCRYTMSGQDKHGVTIRLEGGDELQIIIQDDLSALTSFRVLAAGHVVTD
jgi:hypothetical protein